MSTLSPLTRNSMRQHALFAELAREIPSVPAKDDHGGWRAVRKKYLRFVCPHCAALHESESGAEACCPAEVESVWVNPRDQDDQFDTLQELIESMEKAADEEANCPVCGGTYGDHDEAVNCCLWRDIDHATRHQIAQAVEGGMTWADAIEKFTGEKP